VAERFGEAFVEARDLTKGMEWYERAVAAQDGSASLKAAERLANVRCRRAWEDVDEANRRRQELRERRASRASGRAVAAARQQAEQAFRDAIARADGLLGQASGLLARLGGLDETMERASLAGSVHKRRALVDMAAEGRPARKALRQMLSAYRRAQAAGGRTPEADLYYPALNCLAADAALNGGTRGWSGLDRGVVEVVRRALRAKGGSNADFWSVAGGIELRQYEALAKRRLSSSLKALAGDYKDLHVRVKAAWMWASVYDTACLVLPIYARRAPGRERAAANDLLAKIRLFAHPEPPGRN